MNVKPMIDGLRLSQDHLISTMKNKNFVGRCKCGGRKIAYPLDRPKNQASFIKCEDCENKDGVHYIDIYLNF